MVVLMLRSSTGPSLAGTVETRGSKGEGADPKPRRAAQTRVVSAIVKPAPAADTVDQLAAAIGAGERRETHGSWVLLTRDRAYKIKKPLVLDFLDYGTLERRRAMCLAEVDQNRRGARDVYLGVRAIVATSG